MRTTTFVSTLLTALVLLVPTTAMAAPTDDPKDGEKADAPADKADGEKTDADESDDQPADEKSDDDASDEPEAGEESPADANESDDTEGTEEDGETDADATTAETDEAAAGVSTDEVSVSADTTKSDDKSDDEETSPWIPPGEKEMMAKEPLDPETAHFKPGTGLVLKSKNGRFSMAPRLRVQFRYTFQNDNEDDELGHSFQARRARLQFKGNVFGKHNKYKVEFAFSPRDLGFKNGSPTRTPILTWYTEFDYLRDFTIKVGQYKIPFSRQRVISSGNLEMVDRALAQGEFNLDRDMGIEALSKDVGGLGYLRYHAAVLMGEGRDQFETQDDFGLHYLARVEVLPLGGAAGKWDYSEADFDRLPKPRLSIGAAYSFIDNAKRDRGVLGSTPLDGGTTDYHSVTADFFFKVAGFSLSGEFFWREGKRKFGNATITDDMGNEVPAPRVPTRDGIGYFVQAGYLIPRLPLGVAARWSQIIGLGEGNETSLNNGDEVGAAFSYYIAHHPLKLQLDYFRKRRDAYDVETLSFAKQSWKDSSDEVRLQMQFAF